MVHLFFTITEKEMEAIQELQDKLSTSEASVRKITREKKLAYWATITLILLIIIGYLQNHILKLNKDFVNRKLK